MSYEASSKGLNLCNNGEILSFLTSVSNNQNLGDELREIALDLSKQSSVPYKSLRKLWFSLSPLDRPKLFRLFEGSEFFLSSPKPREKSEELLQRLRKLEEIAERKAYAELVKDIVPKTENQDSFASYKDQLGFGLHVIVTMATCYLVGYAAFRAMFNRSEVMNAAGGIFGLVFAMLLETLLFIIRTTDQEFASLKKEK